MVNHVRNFTRRYPKIHRVLSFTYSRIVYPCTTGHFSFFIKYFLFIKHKEVKRLRDFSLIDAKPVSLLSWRVGRGKDKAYRRYYVAEYNSKKCFVKVGTNDSTVKNEYSLLNQFDMSQIGFSPKYLVGSDAFSDDTTMVAVEYINGLEKFKIPDNMESFDLLCASFLEILKTLELNDIVHADVHKGNLMLQGDNLFLLDYGISKKQDVGNNIDYVARPGTYFIENNGLRKYDDAYSFIKLLDCSDISDEFKKSKNYIEIKNRIDKFTFCVNIDCVGRN